MKKNYINRRIFLHGLGGITVAAPFLGSVAERAAKAQGEVYTDPKRLIVMFTHYGCMTNRWFPQKAHGALTADDFTGTTLEPLGQYADKILLPRGLRAMNQWVANYSTGQANDPHTQVVGTYFSCQPVFPNTNTLDFDFSGPKFNAWPLTATLDHICAKQLSPGGIPLFMRIANNGDSGQSAISYSGFGEEHRYAGVGTPAQAFGNLVGMFGSDEPMDTITYLQQAKKNVVDLCKADIESYERLPMSGDDAQKLAAWKELLYSTGNMMGNSAQCTEETALALGLTDENMLKAAQGDLGVDKATQKITETMDAADVYSAVATLAAVCNANPVIFIKYPANYKYTGLGSNDDSHNVSHRIGGAGMGGECVPGVNEEILRIDDWYAKKFANLVGMLNGIEENGVKLLDNTATIWFQELSDGNAHNLNNMPIIQAGGCGGYFKTGQAVNLDNEMPTLDAGNSEGPCRDNGSVTPTNTGTNQSVGNAPINKYFCNIMNAIGVKAGADGTPAASAEAGVGPVTHFGWSDKTEEFYGGDDGPSKDSHKIHNPGEYTQLKASS